MLTVLSYLGRQFVWRIFEFLEHWYLGSFRVAGGGFMELLRDWDKFFALKITVRHWLEPLYQDRTLIGYILGPIFRTGRILLALMVYLLATFLAGLFYLVWLIIPPAIISYIIYKIISGL